MDTDIIREQIKNGILNIVQTTLDNSLQDVVIDYSKFIINPPLYVDNITYYSFEVPVIITYIKDNVRTAQKTMYDIDNNLNNKAFSTVIRQYDSIYFAHRCNCCLHMEIYGVIRKQKGI